MLSLECSVASCLNYRSLFHCSVLLSEILRQHAGTFTPFVCTVDSVHEHPVHPCLTYRTLSLEHISACRPLIYFLLHPTPPPHYQLYCTTQPAIPTEALGNFSRHFASKETCSKSYSLRSSPSPARHLRSPPSGNRSTQTSARPSSDEPGVSSGHGFLLSAAEVGQPPIIKRWSPFANSNPHYPHTGEDWTVFSTTTEQAERVRGGAAGSSRPDAFWTSPGSALCTSTYAPFACTALTFESVCNPLHAPLKQLPQHDGCCSFWWEDFRTLADDLH
jgi:hypothetical protein